MAATSTRRWSSTSTRPGSKPEPGKSDRREGSHRRRPLLCLSQGGGMERFILKRLGVMALTALCLTFAVFVLTNLHPSLEKLAKNQVNTRMTDAQVELWLANNGYGEPLLWRYGEWLGVVPGWTRSGESGKPTGRCVQPDMPPDQTPRFCGVLQGYLGFSTVFQQPVGGIIGERVALTGWLMLWVMVVMVPMALVV